MSAVSIRSSSRPGAGRGRVLALLLALSLAGCATQVSSSMSDSSPHPGVARAHKMPVQGIDVSRWQGTIDWRAVAGAGVRFAFLKATEGVDYVDPQFQQNWKGAARAGVLRGAYHFMLWCRPVAEQMAWFRRNVPADPSALPPVIDAEWNGNPRSCPRKASREQALSMIREMSAAMEAHTGMRPIIYTDITFHAEVLEGESLPHEFWLRSVAAEPEERYRGRRWHFWQFTTTGRVPGIEGPVDRNAFAGSLAQFQDYHKRTIARAR